jgi:hypothetical protein
MNILQTNQTFSPGEQLSAAKLNALFGTAEFGAGALQTDTLTLDGNGAIGLKAGFPSWNSAGDLTVAGTLTTGGGGVAIYTDGLIHIFDTSPRVKLEDTDAGAEAVAEVIANDGNLTFKADTLNTVSGSNILFNIDGVDLIRVFTNGSTFIRNSAEPADGTISDGGVLYVSGGNLYWKSQGDVVTQLTP